MPRACVLTSVGQGYISSVQDFHPLPTGVLFRTPSTWCWLQLILGPIIERERPSSLGGESCGKNANHHLARTDKLLKESTRRTVASFSSLSPGSVSE